MYNFNVGDCGNSFIWVHFRKIIFAVYTYPQFKEWESEGVLKNLEICNKILLLVKFLSKDHIWTRNKFFFFNSDDCYFLTESLIKYLAIFFSLVSAWTIQNNISECIYPLYIREVFFSNLRRKINMRHKNS